MSLHMSYLDVLALSLLLICWLGFPSFSKWFGKQDLTSAIALYRERWMQTMLNRGDRIADVSLARGLLGTVTFLASTSVLIVSGIVGLIVASESVVLVMNGSFWFAPMDRTQLEMKLGVLLFIFVRTFFKLSWSVRLHSYSSILVGAATLPEQPLDDEGRELAMKAAKMSTLASHHYLGGLTGYYFGFASLAWFIHPVALIVAVFMTVAVLMRREHFSNAVSILRQA